MPPAPQILTIGHSTHATERFVDLISDHGVELVCDVRRFPASRRNPQFNAGVLRDSLAGADVAYMPLGEELGGRRDRDIGAGPRGGGAADAFRAYGEYMETAEFAAGLRRLEELARERRTAIMCAEGEWRHCHRRLISDALLDRGWRVTHISRDGGTEDHRNRLALH